MIKGQKSQFLIGTVNIINLLRSFYETNQEARVSIPYRYGKQEEIKSDTTMGRWEVSIPYRYGKLINLLRSLLMKRSLNSL